MAPPEGAVDLINFTMSMPAEVSLQMSPFGAGLRTHLTPWVCVPATELPVTTMGASSCVIAGDSVTDADSAIHAQLCVRVFSCSLPTSWGRARVGGQEPSVLVVRMVIPIGTEATSEGRSQRLFTAAASPRSRAPSTTSTPGKETPAGRQAARP